LEQAAVRRLAELIEQQRGDSAAHTIRLRRDEIPIVIRTAAARLHVDGVLSLSDGRRHKRFHYRQGEIVDVESSVESDWLGKMLLAEGLITETQLNAAERAVGPRGSAVGEELAARGAISRADLEAARTRQREAVFASVCEWDGAEVGCEHAAAGATGRETVAQPPSAVAAGAQRAAPPPGESNLTPSIRPTIVLAVYYLFLGFVLAYLPLTNYLGLEFSLAVAVAAGLCAGPYAVGRNRDFASDTTVARWTKIATIHALAACLSLAGLAYRVLDDPPCAPCRGAGFFVLLPMVSVWYGSAWGVACGAAIRRKRLAQLAVV
jgi:hypothetical protein